MADQAGTMRMADRPVGAFRVPVSIRLAIVALSLLLSLSQTARAQSGVTQVMVVASMHGLHKTSTAYSYETLYALVRDFKPDLVGVEIRPEDLGRDPEYLQDNYPKEMIELAQTWGQRAFGFDWLGNDVAGAPIPHDWWTQGSPLKRLERELDQDPAFKSKQLDAIRAQQRDILRTATPSSLNDGRYDRLNDAYYARLQQQLHGTRYAPIAQFYARRDRTIDLNMETQIRAHTGERIVLVMGADHRSAALRSLRRRLGSAVKIVPVVPAVAAPNAP